MKKNIIIKFLVVTLVLIFAFIISEYAFAAFNISVSPYEGGTDLQFGKVKNYGPYISKEVTIDITSDIGKQYQLIQTLIEPLSNDWGGMSVPQNNFTVYGLRGSNKYGTLSAEQELPVSIGRSIVYTSTPAGNSDSFNLVYVLKNPFGVSSGYYRGRVAFTLEPIGSTQEPVTVILNVFADLEIESGIEIKTATGSKVISLSSSQRDTFSNSVLVEIKGGMGYKFKIFQLLPQPFESAEGRRLPFEAVNFRISEAKYGSGPTQPITLSQRQEVIYASGSSGEADKFVVTYNLVEPEKQKAGRYKANIKYYLESPAANDLLDNFDLEVEIARVFDLIITPELGGVIEFRNLKPEEAPQQSEVIIEVNSNTGKQYQISQRVVSGLVNAQGKNIPSENFTLTEESLGTKGSLQFGSPAQVRMGETVLFVSDKEGSSDKFKVIYGLIPSLDIMAGNYSTRITYSISEI
ncbi:MAG: hypothetical protein V2A64_02090 [Candidatus Omnitrophota bacterium]